jgi:hypothetical protein
MGVDIRWGTYTDPSSKIVYEGPYTFGVSKYEVGESPSNAEKVFAVLTATEGNSPSAVNMYDSCVLSVGYIQLCEKHGLTSKLLGEFPEHTLEPIHRFFEERNPQAHLSYSKDLRRKGFRFGTDDAWQHRRQVFFGGSYGHKGDWLPSSVQYAENFIRAMVAVLENPLNIPVQKAFVLQLMNKFLLPQSSDLHGSLASHGLEGAIRALLVSFAGNNPTRCEEAVAKTLPLVRVHGIGSPRWHKPLVHNLVKMHGIPIYTQRYEKVRAVINALYNVELPPLEVSTTVQSIQTGLQHLGYDLGPAGVDGKLGHKTRKAFKALLSDQGLPNMDIESTTAVALLRGLVETELRSELQ